MKYAIFSLSQAPWELKSTAELLSFHSQLASPRFQERLLWWIPNFLFPAPHFFSYTFL